MVGVGCVDTIGGGSAGGVDTIGGGVWILIEL